MRKLKRLKPCSALLAGILMAAAAPAVAQVVNEVEPNDSLASAQKLTLVVPPGNTKGGATVSGVIGVLTGSAVLDLDYYSFQGTAGDLVTIDIDSGIGGARSVDTILAIWGPAPANISFMQKDDAGLPLDPDSVSGLDARIDKFLLPTTGTYTVGVSSSPRRFTTTGTTTSTSLNSKSNGDYTLIVSGVSSPLLHISIDVKPGEANDEPSPVNPKSHGKLPVALLSAADFNALDVAVVSLAFGAKGDESSLSKCHQDGQDFNGDGRLDLLCHFETQNAGFSEVSEEAILTGKMLDGRMFEGRGRLKVTPKKARF